MVGDACERTGLERQDDDVVIVTERPPAKAGGFVNG
jgi:hypothetical protein